MQQPARNEDQSQDRKINIKFMCKKRSVTVHMKIQQKFRKAMNFACKEFGISVPLQEVRFFHNKIELTKDSTPESAQIGKNDIVHVIYNEKLNQNLNATTNLNTTIKTEPVLENTDPVNETNMNQENMDPSLNNIMPNYDISTQRHKPIDTIATQETEPVEQMECNTDNGIVNNGETMAENQNTKVPESNSLAEAKLDDTPLVDEQATMEQMELIHEEQTPSTSTTHLVEEQIEKSEANVTDEMKRKRDSLTEINEPAAKSIKMADDFEKSIEHDKARNFVKNFLDYCMGEAKQFFVEEEDEIKSFKMEIENLKKALTKAENLRDSYAKELQEFRERTAAEQTNQSEINALKETHKLEIDGLKKNHDILIENITKENDRLLGINADLVDQQRMVQPEMDKWKAECTLWQNKYAELEQQHEDDILAERNNADKELEDLNIQHETEKANLQSELVAQQKLAGKEIERLTASYETQIANLKASLNAQNEEKPHGSGIVKMKEEKVDLALASKFESLKKMYLEKSNEFGELSQRYNRDVGHQNVAIAGYQRQINQLKEQVGQCDDLKKQRDNLIKENDKLKQARQHQNDVIVKVQRERNEYITKWKSARTEMDRNYEKMRLEYETRISKVKSDFDNSILQTKNQYETRLNHVISQTRQTVLIANLNAAPANVPISTPSPSVTPQPESTSTTPTLAAIGNKDRKCTQCGCKTRMFTTITCCSSDCKRNYFKTELEKMASKQTDV